MSNLPSVNLYQKAMSFSTAVEIPQKETRASESGIQLLTLAFFGNDKSVINLHFPGSDLGLTPKQLMIKPYSGASLKGPAIDPKTSSSFK